MASQHNAWIHAVATVVVTATGLFVGLSWSEWCWIVAERAKDVAAGAVLIAAIWAHHHWGIGVLAEGGRSGPLKQRPTKQPQPKARVSSCEGSTTTAPRQGS